MATTMPGKPFNESDFPPMGLHMLNQPHPPMHGNPSKAPAPNPYNPQKLPSLKQEGFNGGGGMGSPVMKGRVFDGHGGMIDTRSLPNVGEGAFSHLSERGRESTDSDRRRKQFARVRVLLQFVSFIVRYICKISRNACT